MKKKELQIISILQKKHDWTTASALAASLGCSSRSIKTYITSINDEYNNIIISSRSGYKLSKNVDEKTLIEEDAGVYDDIRSRRLYLERKLLGAKEKISVDSLLEELHISSMTLDKDINYIKKQLIAYDLTLKTKYDKVYIDGSNTDKREMVLDIIYDEMSDSIANISRIQTFFPNVDINNIHSIVNHSLRNANCYMDDYSLMNVILWLAIYIDQEQNSELSNRFYQLGSDFESAHLKEIINSIAISIHDEYDVNLSRDELENLALLINTRISKKDMDFLNTSLQPELLDLIASIQAQIKDTFNINLGFNDKDIRFGLHLQNLLMRLKNNVILKNPQLAEVKKSYPYVYDIAVTVANAVKEKTGYTVPEDEIGFFAIHLGIMLEELFDFNSKIKVVLICPKYFSLHSDLHTQIRDIFNKDLVIVDVISFTDELKNIADYDFVISTTLFSTSQKNVVFVKTKLDFDDIYAINKEIEFQKVKKMKKTFESNLSDLITDDFYFYSPNYADRYDVIHKISEKMYKEDYVPEDFEDRLLERESISSSVIGNIAIPHPLNSNAYKSLISIAVLPKGMIWQDDMEVHLILTLAINEADKDHFQDIFHLVTDFISDENNFHALMGAKTCKEFKKLIISFFTNKIK